MDKKKQTKILSKKSSNESTDKNKIKEGNKDYIDFAEVQDSLLIGGKSEFKLYLKEVYKDLAEKANDGTKSSKKLGISKIIFFEYLKLPIIIAETMFTAFDNDKDGYLKLSEFTEGLTNLYLGTFEEVSSVIFKIYDTDNDSLIHKEDVRLILSYLPLKKDKTKKELKYQIESQQEIDEIVNSTFLNKDKIKYKEYLEVIQTKKSDSFIQLICYIYQKKPFNKINIDLLLNNSDYSTPIKNVIEDQSISKFSLEGDSSSPNKDSPLKVEKKLLPSPKKSFLSPMHSHIKKNRQSMINTDSGNCFNLISLEGLPKKKTNNTSNYSIEQSAKDGMLRHPNKNTANINNPNKSNNEFDSPSNFLRRISTKQNMNKKEFSLENNLIKLVPTKLSEKNKQNQPKKDIKDISSSEDEDFSSSDDEFEQTTNKINSLSLSDNKTSLPAMEGWVYKLTETKLKKYWLVVNNKDIYYYKSDKKTDLSGMHNLSGCYIQEIDSKKIGSDKYYSFGIDFPTKTRTYFTKEKEDSEGWINRLKNAVGYESFFDIYDIKEDLGEGKFGLVKLGIHKKTNQKVAIKTIKKESLEGAKDYELVKGEIDIMKLCRHPNIVALLDHFENSEYIFIIMEYIQGGDLNTYLYEKGNSLSEKKSKELMKQLASGIQYLHRYGIAHRDLKPENIMLTSNCNKGEIKIMDFGLSKIMYHEEKVDDGFGTLVYVAPEVLTREPYNKQVDIWSLGIILFNLISGKLPFDDEEDNEELIAKQIVYSDVSFQDKSFKSISPHCTDLIKQSLIKKADKRIKIDDFIKHKWFSN